MSYRRVNVKTKVRCNIVVQLLLCFFAFSAAQEQGLKTTDSIEALTTKIPITFSIKPEGTITTFDDKTIRLNEPLSVTAGKHRIILTKDGYLPIITTIDVHKNSTSFVFELEKMVLVKGGVFEMGCDSLTADCDFDEYPFHTVNLADFYFAKTEITIRQWHDFINNTGYKGDNLSSHLECSGTANPKFLTLEGNHPVCCVTWNEAKAYCDWMSEKTNENFRLPTEAEWEYAASINIDSLSFCSWNFNNSNGLYHKVARKKPNDLGLFDMMGNLWEWCSDIYDENYYENSPMDNPKGASVGSLRVLRGGSWNSDPKYLRRSNRLSNSPDYASQSVGFRIACDINSTLILQDADEKTEFQFPIAVKVDVQLEDIGDLENQWDKKPTIKISNKIDYPPTTGFEKPDLVIILFYVDDLGNVVKYNIVQSSGYEYFDKAAIDSIINTKFTAGEKMGKPVGGWMMIPVEFSLD